MEIPDFFISPKGPKLLPSSFLFDKSAKNDVENDGVEEPKHNLQGPSKHYTNTSLFICQIRRIDYNIKEQKMKYLFQIKKENSQFVHNSQR